MIGDAQLSFGQVNFASTNLAGAGFVEFPLCLDVNELRDIGKGGPLTFQIHVDTDVNVAITGGIDYMTMDFQLAFDVGTGGFAAQTIDVVQKSATLAANNSEAPVDGGNFNAGRLAAGNDFYVCLPPQPQGSNGNRYLKCIVAAGLASGGNVTSGKVTVKLATAADLQTRHPTGYTV